MIIRDLRNMDLLAQLVDKEVGSCEILLCRYLSLIARSSL